MDLNMTLYSGIPERILRLDRSIRFCAVVDRLGYVVDAKARANLEPLLTAEEMDRCALLVSLRYRTRTAFEEKLGRAQCMVTYYEKVIMASMSLADNDLVLVTVDNAADFQSIMRKVQRLISKHRALL